MEIGIIDHFLQLSHAMYSHLATKTLMKQIWNETEPNGLTLKCADNIMWTPQLPGRSEIAIMEFAMTIYPKKLSTKNLTLR